jgi:hypothetical protein
VIIVKMMVKEVETFYAFGLALTAFDGAEPPTLFLATIDNVYVTAASRFEIVRGLAIVAGKLPAGRAGALVTV